MAGKVDDAVVVVVPPCGRSNRSCPDDAARALSLSTAISTSTSTSTPLDAELAVLPATITCKFAGEGSANAVFQMAPGATAAAAAAVSTPSSLHPSLLASYLLRVPKAAPGLNPHVCIDHHTYYASVLQPLLGPDCLVTQQLVCGVAQLRPQLNRLLAAHDEEDSRHSNGHSHRSRRRPDWAGCPVADNVDVALLVEDMTAAAATSTITIQFKPKWLAQSPTAPPGARRCRTCALSAALTSKGPEKTSRTPKPCPLVLVARKSVRANGTANGTTNGAANGAANGITKGPAKGSTKLAHHTDNSLDDALWDYICRHLGPDNDAVLALPPASRAAIVRWLRTTDLFSRLASIQTEYDPLGALCVQLGPNSKPRKQQQQPGEKGTATAEALDRLQTAMTLRDCTCYLRVSLHADGRVQSISAKLGDLDRKDGRHRLARWQAQERELIDGGFYAAAEEPPQTSQCWLGR